MNHATTGEIAAATMVLVLCVVVVLAIGFFAKSRGFNIPQPYHWRILNVSVFYAVGIIFGMMGGHEGGPWGLADSIYFTTVTVSSIHAHTISSPL